MAVISLNSINWLIFEMQLESAFCKLGFQWLYICYIIVILHRAESGPSFRCCLYNYDNDFDDLLQFTEQVWMADIEYNYLLRTVTN